MSQKMRSTFEVERKREEIAESTVYSGEDKRVLETLFRWLLDGDDDALKEIEIG